MKLYKKIKILSDIMKGCIFAYIIGTLGMAMRNFGILFFQTYFASTVVQIAETGAFEELWTAVSYLILCLIVFCVVDTLFQYLHNTITHKMSMQLRGSVYDCILHSDLYYLGKYINKAEIVSRMNQDINLVMSMLKAQILLPLMFCFSGIGATAAIAMKNGGIVLLICIYSISVIILLGQKWISGRIQSAQKEMQESHKEVSERYMETIDHAIEIKLSGHQNYLLYSFRKKAEKQEKVANTVAKLQAYNAVINLSVMFVKYTGGIVLGILLYAKGIFTLADIVFAAPMSGMIVNMVTMLGNSLVSLKQSVIGLDRILEILNLPQEDLRENGICEKDNTALAVQTEHLKFSYADSRIILNDVNIQIECGEQIAVVGKSGCGKSTLIKTLMGLYPYQGSCKIWGNEVKEYNLSYLRERIAYVPQNHVITAGTIRENLLSGNDRICAESEITDVLQKLGAEEWVQKQGGPDGILTENGGSLSGGQRQSLAVARVLLQKKDLVILDETLSAMDHAAKEQTMKVLREQSGSTIMIVTHDPEVIKKCNRTIYINSYK